MNNNRKTYTYLLTIIYFSLQSCTEITTQKEKIPSDVKKNICFDNFAVLHNDKTKIYFNEVTLSPTFISIKQGDNKYLEILKYSLNQKYKLEHIFLRGLITEDSGNDSISVLGQTHCIRQLMRDKGVNYTSQLTTMFHRVYSFHLQDKEFLLLLIEDGQLGGTGTYYNQIAILYDTGLEKAMPILLGEENDARLGGPAINCYPDYLGDFNNDGILDYVHWGGGGDTLKVYTLDNDSLKLIPNKYLKLESTHYTNPKGERIECNSYQVCIDDSNWFYSFDSTKFSSLPCDTCNFQYSPLSRIEHYDYLLRDIDPNRRAITH